MRRKSAFELLGQSKLPENLGNMDAGSSTAGRIGVDDGLCGEKRPLCSIGDAIESVAHDRQVFSAGLSDAQSLPFAVEKLDTEFRLQRFDLMTHRTLSDGKLLGGAT